MPWGPSIGSKLLLSSCSNYLISLGSSLQAQILGLSPTPVKGQAKLLANLQGPKIAIEAWDSLLPFFIR